MANSADDGHYVQNYMQKCTLLPDFQSCELCNGKTQSTVSLK